MLWYIGDSMSCLHTMVYYISAMTVLASSL